MFIIWTSDIQTQYFRTNCFDELSTAQYEAITITRTMVTGEYYSNIVKITVTVPHLAALGPGHWRPSGTDFMACDT